MSRNRQYVTFGADERAVSNLVGYVLAFSVIVSAVGFVSVYGVGVLETVQQAEQDDNAEFALDVVAARFAELERGEAPRRASDVSLHDGGLTVENKTVFAVEVERPAGPNPSYEIYPGTIELRTGRNDDDRIVYENGATLRGNVDAGGQAAMGVEPRFVCRDDVAVLSFVRLNGSVARSFGGGTVRVSGVRRDTAVLYPLNATGTNSSRDATGVTVTITSTFDRGWASSLVENGDDWQDTGPSTVTCDVGSTGRVLVRETVIDLAVAR